MSIVDVGNQFKSLADDKVKLVRVTMDYEEGVQVFRFRVSKKGETTTIESDAISHSDIAESVRDAAERAIVWADAR